MRLGIVRGHLTLTPAVESYHGRTLKIVEPVTMENLRAGNGLGGGKAADRRGRAGRDHGPKWWHLRKGARRPILFGLNLFQWMRIWP